MATVKILFEGYLGRPDHRVAPTVGLIQDNNAVVVVDPGMLPSPAAILGPMAALGLAPENVTDVVFSHHHPDHTLNAALFPDAAFHDHWAVYRHDVWEDRDAEGSNISPNITLIRVPGHSHEDIATLASTKDGLIVFTHAWWTSSGPAEDPYAPDRELLRQSRARILGLNPRLIVPGHGPAFEPNRNTPL
jgi:glyoxylase-like metal-dependent hydrolase (beta-lactamase superfamily II)